MGNNHSSPNLTLFLNFSFPQSYKMMFYTITDIKNPASGFSESCSCCELRGNTLGISCKAKLTNICVVL